MNYFIETLVDIEDFYMHGKMNTMSSLTKFHLHRAVLSQEQSDR